MLDSNRDDNGHLKPNAILRTRYKIIRTLHDGAEKTIYQAQDLLFPEVERWVAIKELQYPAVDAQNRTIQANTFQREANILATLKHQAIPCIFDFFSDDTHAYQVMEYIDGNSLQMLINQEIEPPIQTVIRWAIDLCDILEYLHNDPPQPIMHRNIKPTAIMIDPQGHVRLLGFDIAKISDKAIKKHTMIGTEGYAAPEQYKGQVTPLSDIYGLGATLHYFITRKDPGLEPPFSFNERPAHEHNKAVPEELTAILNKALAFDAKDRWQSAAEMKAALERL